MPLTTRYKYTNIIRVSERIELIAPSGGSVKRPKRKLYGIDKLNESS